MKRLLASLVLLVGGLLWAQTQGAVVEVFAPQINAQVRITGCVRDTQNRVVCAVVFESRAQTNQTVSVFQSSIRALAPNGALYPGRLSVEGGTEDETKAVFGFPTGARVNGRITFEGVPPEVTLFPLITLGGLEFRGIPITGARETPAQAQAPKAPAPAPRTSNLPFDSWEDLENRLGVGPVSVIYLARDGTVWAWGNNEWGQLGIGKTSKAEPKPVQVQGLPKNIVAVAMGWDHALALTRDGVVYAWGNNDRGQIGANPNPLLPYPVRGLKDVVAIRAGVKTSYALRRDGTLWAWGTGEWGKLGDGSFQDTLYPTQVKIEGVKAFPRGVFGDAVAGVLKEDGTVWVWGHSARGLLGDGKNCFHWGHSSWAWEWGQPAPTQVPGLKDVVQLAVGGAHFVALTRDGGVWAWGLSHRGQSGIFNNYCAPLTKIPLKEVVAVNAGGLTSSALTQDGTLWMWGAHTSWNGPDGAFYGMLGIGPTKRDWASPASPIGMDEVAFWKGWDTTFAVKKDGSVWAWGRNEFG